MRALERLGFEPYFEAFAEPDHTKRFGLLSQSLTPDAQIWGPKRVFSGYVEISEKIDGFHRNWPGCRLVVIGGINCFNSAARIGSGIVGADGSVLAAGESIIELALDGRICRVLPFWEAPLPLPESWPTHLTVQSVQCSRVRPSISVKSFASRIGTLQRRGTFYLVTEQSRTEAAWKDLGALWGTLVVRRLNIRAEVTTRKKERCILRCFGSMVGWSHTNQAGGCGKRLTKVTTS